MIEPSSTSSERLPSTKWKHIATVASVIVAVLGASVVLKSVAVSEFVGHLTGDSVSLVEVQAAGAIMCLVACFGIIRSGSDWQPDDDDGTHTRRYQGR